MYSSVQRLEERRSTGDLDRPSYLCELVRNFTNEKRSVAKMALATQLANFAYDPVNFDALRELNVMDLFLDLCRDPAHVVGEDVPAARCTAIGAKGLCNIVADRTHSALLSCDAERRSIVARAFLQAEARPLTVDVTNILSNLLAVAIQCEMLGTPLPEFRFGGSAFPALERLTETKQKPLRCYVDELRQLTR